MSEIPNSINDDLTFEDVHQKFSQSEFGTELDGRPRWDRYKPEHISDNQWIETLGNDVDNLQHHPLTYLVTREFLIQCHAGSETDELAQFDEYESKILLLASICNDWGESVVGDINYELKTTEDDELEKKEFAKVFGHVLGDKYVKELHIVRDVLFEDDASSKLGKAFNAIERITYIQTALFAFEASQTTDDEVFAGHLQWLAAGTLPNHVSVLSEYAKIYPPVRDFMTANEGRISEAFDALQPNIFPQHGQTEKQKQEQFLFEKSKWENRKAKDAEEVEAELVGSLKTKLSEEEVEKVVKALRQYGDMRAQPATKEYVSREAYDRGIFGSSSNLEARFVNDYESISKLAEACRTLGLKIVLTSGTYDLLHVGHAAYLEKARQHGDILFVGVDSDEKVRTRKGPTRPVVPENERVAILSHMRSVDVITLKDLDEEKWGLIKTVRPDTLIATAETYSDEEIKKLQDYCGRVVVLPPQAQTSTSARIRRLHIDLGEQIKQKLPKHIEEFVSEIVEGNE